VSSLKGGERNFKKRRRNSAPQNIYRGGGVFYGGKEGDRNPLSKKRRRGGVPRRWDRKGRGAFPEGGGGGGWGISSFWGEGLSILRRISYSRGKILSRGEKKGRLSMKRKKEGGILLTEKREELHLSIKKGGNHYHVKERGNAPFFAKKERFGEKKGNELTLQGVLGGGGLERRKRQHCSNSGKNKCRADQFLGNKGRKRLNSIRRGGKGGGVLDSGGDAVHSGKK